MQTFLAIVGGWFALSFTCGAVYAVLGYRLNKARGRADPRFGRKITEEETANDANGILPLAPGL